MLKIVICFIVLWNVIVSERLLTTKRNTPVMGWSSRMNYGCSVNESVILETVKMIKELALDKVGFEYVIVDDCWMENERNNGTKQIEGDTEKWPRGLNWLGDRIHEAGLKFGLHLSVGERTCKGGAGSYGFEEQDIETLMEWGCDLVQLDGCFLSIYQSKDTISSDVEKFAKALVAANRDCVLSVDVPNLEVYKWGRKAGVSMGRESHDIKPNWEAIMEIIDFNEPLHKFAKDNYWNHLDVLAFGVHDSETNSKGLSRIETKTHFSFWLLFHAPLILSVQLSSLTPFMRDMISNQKAISIGQDSLGIQGTRLWAIDTEHVRKEVWWKKLSNDKRAVLFFNRANDTSTNDPKYHQNETFSIQWKNIELDDVPIRVYDVWNQQDLGTFKKEFKSLTPLKQHECQLLIMERSTNGNIGLIIALIVVLCLCCTLPVGVFVVITIVCIKKRASNDKTLYEEKEPIEIIDPETLQEFEKTQTSIHPL